MPIELLECGRAGLVARDDWEGLPIDEQLRLVRQAWQEPAERLLIFDNCEEEEILQAWSPTSGGCKAGAHQPPDTLVAGAGG